VIVGIGIVVNNDRCEIVIPMSTDDVTLDGNQLCRDAKDAVTNTLIPVLLDCLSADAYVSYVLVEGMVDGKVPTRQVFGPTDFPGTRAAGAMPSQVAALAVWYEDAADAITGERTRVAKNFIPGIADTDVVHDLIQTTLFNNIVSFCNLLVTGVSFTGTKTWYRVLAAIRTPAAGLRRVLITGPRNYVATQRRRLVPRL
jgi:hypothetical protein